MVGNRILENSILVYSPSKTMIQSWTTQKMQTLLALQNLTSEADYNMQR